MIRVKGLNVSIAGSRILEHVTLGIDTGEVFGLVGESGSGKSMTALSIMGLLPRAAHRSGSIRLDDRELTELTPAAWRQLRGNEIGMVFQEPMTALNPVQTIGDQVAETLMIHGKARRAEAHRIARARLDRVGLAHIPADRYPHSLSGGQRQRVCIAAAIALHPRLLIADEPTTALDVTTQAQILTLLKDLVEEENMSLLLITHDLGVISQMADRVAVMRDGQIVEQGGTRSVLEAGQHAYTNALVAAATYAPKRRNEPKGEAILTVRDLHRHYPGPRKFFRPGAPVKAVNGVSFDLFEGESLGLVGESGCGKTTLMRTLLGLDPTTSGRVNLRGQTVSLRMERHLRADLQAVFQDPFGSFDPRWRVERILSEPFHLLEERLSARARRDQIAEALEAVRLRPDDMEKYPHEFSGGQRQRIAIARALITRPKVIILDEPVSALDVSVRGQVMDLLADLQHLYGLSYLFIAHDLALVRAVTDRVLIMHQGRIVEAGTSDQVFAAPQHAYSKRLLDAVPTLFRDRARR